MMSSTSSSSSAHVMIPPQTPMGPPRTATGTGQTPHKTPFRTPLRTPGGGEQTSHTPVINFAAIEAQKENVQPLRGGRSAHALSNALSQRQTELKEQRKAFEQEVTSVDNAESDDPLDAWSRYVKWCIDSYPSGQTSESELVLVLERCTRAFRSYAQYKNDTRYLRMWILYARNVESPSDVYNFLLANELCTSLASLYEELAAVYEGQSYFDKADETYKMGVHRNAQPIDRLKRRFQEFQHRIVAQEGTGGGTSDQRAAYKQALVSAMHRAQRSMLGAKTGSTSMSANSVRGLGGQAGLAKVSSSNSSNNARRPAVFKDADGDDVFAQAKGTNRSGSAWSDVGTSASRKQEKSVESKAWKGEILPQREGVATPKRPAIAVYRDSDEDEASDDTRTPGRSKIGDVFSKASEPSETDRLRRNPFANYNEADTKPTSNPDKKLKRAPTAPASATAPSTHKAKKPSSSVSAHSAQRAASGDSSRHKHKEIVEVYIVPLQRLYPGLDIEHALKRGSRKPRASDITLEQLLARPYLAEFDKNKPDPWAYLDALIGKWLPEIKPPSKPTVAKRDPTVTAFTKAAQDDVMQMFNVGMVDSDEESDEDVQSDSEEEEDNGDDVVFDNRVQTGAKEMMKENEICSASFTPTPGPRGFKDAMPERRPLGEVAMLGAPVSIQSNSNANSAQTPLRKAFGGDRKPLAFRSDANSSSSQEAPEHRPIMPQRVTSRVLMDANNEEEDDDDEDSALAEEEDHSEMRNSHDEVDYLNRPMRELAPLSPITEATEYTRYTHSTRTPATTSTGRASQAWTPSALATESQQCSYEAGDESTYGSRSAQQSIRSLSLPSATLNEQSSSTYPNPVCPVDADVIQRILQALDLPLESSSDYVNMSGQQADQLQGLQKRANAIANKLRRSSSQTSLVNAGSTNNAWTVSIGEHVLCIRQKLGEGGYGAVFLAEDHPGITGRQRLVGGINGDASFADLDTFGHEDDSLMNDLSDVNEPKLIAVKVETPPNRWEFYILGQLRARLSDERRLSSIICARKFFCFDDESFLLLEYAEKGTLLEIVNNAVKAGVASSSAIAAEGACVGVDEILAMFFVVEVIKVVEALHAVDLLHGDLKIDNCLLRLDESEGDCAWTHSYDRNGANGWSAKGITLIDFGRAIDLRQFPAPDQRFVADWTPEQHDMPQIQQGASWRKEIDYYGIASIAYCLLFGKYIETTANHDGGKDGDAGESLSYSIDKPLRRYWQVDIWTALFALCLNAGRLPSEQAASEELASVRERMEQWLEDNCFRAGKNLKGSLKKLELWSMKRSM